MDQRAQGAGGSGESRRSDGGDDRSSVDPRGQVPALDAGSLECGNLLRFGREPRQPLAPTNYWISQLTVEMRVLSEVVEL